MSITFNASDKDIVILATKEDHAEPSKIELPELERSPGLILPNGEINWNCPCLGGMATGPCGVQFREALSCFHFSKAEPKGSDCYEVFSSMQECMSKYPALYDRDDDDNDITNFENLEDGEDSKHIETPSAESIPESTGEIDKKP